MHRHYDGGGNLVGITEVESPWTDDARDEAEALWEADRLICPACGNLREDCANPDLTWFPQRHVCYASRQQAVADRVYGEKHNDKPFHDGRDKVWAKSFSSKTPFHFRDGIRIWASQHDLTPDDAFI